MIFTHNRLSQLLICSRCRFLAFSTWVVKWSNSARLAPISSKLGTNHSIKPLQHAINTAKPPKYQRLECQSKSFFACCRCWVTDPMRFICVSVVLPLLMDRISRIKYSSMAACRRWLDEAFHGCRTITNAWHNLQHRSNC